MEQKPIAVDLFGQYALLAPSNSGPIKHVGITFPSVAHALLALQTDDLPTRLKISQIDSAYAAYHFVGKNIKHSSRNSIRFLIKTAICLMENISRDNVAWKKKLLSTENASIHYFNLYNDLLFGLIDGSIKDLSKASGLNIWGRLLVKKRERIKKAIL